MQVGRMMTRERGQWGAALLFLFGWAAGCGTGGTAPEGDGPADSSPDEGGASTGGRAGGGQDGSGGDASGGSGSGGDPATGGSGGSPSEGGFGGAGAAGGMGGQPSTGWTDPITAHWSEEPPFGYVSVSADWYVGFDDADDEFGMFSAGFWETHDEPCSFEQFGSHCVLQRCTATTFPNEANAGLLDAAIDGTDEMDLSYNYTARRYQQTLDTNFAPWTEGGLLLQVRATGRTEPFPEGEVPAFMADLTTPDRIVITEPALDAQTDSDPVPATVVRSEGFTTEWSGTSPGSVEVSVSYQVSGDRRYATCRFDPSLGTGTVPAELLAELPAGSGSLFIRTTDQKIVEVGDWRLLVSGTTDAVTADLKSPYLFIDLE